MKKIAAWICIISLVLLGGAGLLYRYALKRDFFFAEIEALIKQETGYTLTKTDSLEFSLLPNPALTAQQLVITNASSQSNPILARVKRLSFSLQWAPLLKQKVVIDLGLDAADISLAMDSQGIPSWMTEELQGVAGGLPFDVDRVNAAKTRVVFRNDKTNEILGLDLDKIDIDLGKGITRAHIDSAGRLGGSRFYAVGDVEFKSENNQLDLKLAVGAGEAEKTNIDAIKASSAAQWINQNLTFFPLDSGVEGSIYFRDGVPHGELNFEAEMKALDAFAYLAEPLSYLKKELGPASASGIIALNGSDLDIANLQIGLHHQQLEIEANGSVQNLLSDVRFNLDLSVKAKNPDKVIKPESVTGFAKRLIPEVGSVDLKASISGEKGEILFSGMDLGFAYNSLDARVGGDLQLKQDDMAFGLELRGEATETTDLLKLLGIESEALLEPGSAVYGSLSLAARVSLQQDSYSIEYGSVQLQDGNINATLAGNLGMIDSKLAFDLDASLDVRDFSQLATYFPAEFEPDLQGLGGSAISTIRGTLEDFSLSKMEINLAQQDRQLHLQGQLSHLPDNLISDTEFHFLSDRPFELEQYFSKLKNLQLTGPLDLAATIKSDTDKIHIEHIRFQAVDTDVSGDVAIDLGQDPPRLTVELQSRRFKTGLVTIDPEVALSDPEALNPVQERLQPEPETTVEAELSGKELGEMFRAYTAGIGIETAWIRDLNLYFSISADKAQVGDYEGENLALTLDASNGVFRLVEYEILLDGKPVSFSGSIDTNALLPVYKFSGDIQQGSLEALLNVDKNLMEGGELSGGFVLTSKGSDLGALIENLNGNAMVTMGPLTIRSNVLTTLSADMLSSILKGIVRNKEDEPASYYQCGVLAVDVVKGVATANKTFTLQADDYILAGKGKLDLNNGFVDIKVYPKARKGIGFSISTLVGGFRIKGHLATPDFSVGGGGLVTAAIAGYALAPSLVAASSTNPVTATVVFTGLVAKGFFDRLTASSYTCESVIKRIERQRAKNTPKNQQSGKRNNGRSIDRVPPAYQR